MTSETPDAPQKSPRWQDRRDAPVAIGLCLGLAIGAAIDNPGAGMAIGIAIGVAVASKRRADASKK